MALNFPASPTTGQKFTSGAQTWTYDGTKWISSTSAVTGATGFIGATGTTLSPAGSTGFIQYYASATTLGATGALFWDVTNSRLGIGTQSPGGILDVTAPSSGIHQSWFRSSGTNGTFIELGNSTNGYVEFQVEGTTGNFYLNHNGGAGAVLRSYRSGAVTNTLVLNSGYACIGTTSGTSTVGTAINTSYDANSTIVIGKNNGAGSNNWIEFFYGGASRGYINYNGSGVSYTSTSDYRLKENVVPFVNGLQTVNQLKPVNFDWKENGQTSTGFIAHEVQSVVPEAVSGKKDDVDQEGKPLYQGIDQSKLVVYLVAAIQELTAKVAALETSNTGATGISGATGI